MSADGWAVTFGTARRNLGGLRPAQSPPHCTKCNSPPINGLCTNFILFDVVLYLPLNSKGLNNKLLRSNQIILIQAAVAVDHKRMERKIRQQQNRQNKVTRHNKHTQVHKTQKYENF